MCIITCVGNVKIKKFSSKKQIFCEETSFDKLRMNGLKSRFGHEKMCITDSQSERNLKNIEMHNETFITTLSSLHEAIIDFKHQNRQIAFQEYQKSRDSLIYRFKFCADLFWKFLNDQLRIQGVVVEIARPKSIFKESCDAGFISLGELQNLKQEIMKISQENPSKENYIDEFEFKRSLVYISNKDIKLTFLSQNEIMNKDSFFSIVENSNLSKKINEHKENFNPKKSKKIKRFTIIYFSKK